MSSSLVGVGQVPGQAQGKGPGGNDTLPLIDHRIYTIKLRKMPEFLEVFNRLALPILLETLGNPVGFYTSQVGPLNQFVHLWAYQDMSDYERRCNARDTHPGFPAYLSASEHLIEAQETRLIRAVEFSKSLQQNRRKQGALHETNQR